MRRCAIVITHAGHGTLARALASGCPVVAVPHAGDMAENAARADWAGVGVRLPWRLLGVPSLRLAVRRALAAPQLATRAAELARWATTHDGAQRAAELVERL
jgi:UDP:flavonoid glycosyltransferase YjiC (YdhE family)